MIKYCICILVIACLIGYLYWALDVQTSDPPQIMRAINRGVALAIFGSGFICMNKWVWKF